MKIFSKQTVFEAALDRMRFIFDEFEEVILNFSGGKDSTVILNLALMIAEEKGKLPLKVLFLDQEAEWTFTIDYVRKVMSDPRVKPIWLQIPFRLGTSTTNETAFLNCWHPEEREQWIRPQEEMSVKENVYGTDRFYDMFLAVLKHEADGKLACNIAGVRCEESPNRRTALTHFAAYKWVTWAKKYKTDPNLFTMYPIYDWSYTDIWKAIHDNGWEYCKLYDYMFSHGVNLNDMRLSSLLHETAIRSLYVLQEIDPENWEKIAARLSGVNTIAMLKSDALKCPKELPSMFDTWEEYRDYLLDHLITDEKLHDRFSRRFKQMATRYQWLARPEMMHKAQITSILGNDTDLVRLKSWESKPDIINYRRHIRGMPYNGTTKQIKEGTYGIAKTATGD